MARAKALLEAGKDQDARSILDKILQELPMEPVAQEAAALLQDEAVEQKQLLLPPEVIEANRKVDPRVGQHAKRADGKEYSKRAEEAVVAASVKLTQIHLMLNAYASANEVVDGLLATYPENAELLQLKQRIAQVEASGQTAVILGRSRDP